MNIYQRINAVMKDVTYVQKDAHIKEGGNYKAVSHDQVVSVARASLVKHGIVVFPEQRVGRIQETRQTGSGKPMILYCGEYVIHFVNVEDAADRISVPVQAHALDMGDKAPGKCVTYATKTAMLKVLCLETGENDESRAEVREQSAPITDEQAEQIRKRLDALGSDVAKFCQWARVSSIAEIPSGRLDDVMKKLAQAEKARAAA